VRQLIRKYIPTHFHNPVGLAMRLIKSRDPAALFAMTSAATGLLATPLDLLLTPLERTYDRKESATQHPLIVVCGAPRSGTTVVYQTLVQHLPVAYFSNLTSLFPRSPLTATQLFGRFLGRPSGEYGSFYGKTRRLSGTNDALYLWDRWLGSDRGKPPSEISAAKGQQMRRFFAAWQQVFAKPLVSKNNNLNVSAHLVAEHIPNMYFLCMTRRPRDLAQSLYRARCDIHGSPTSPYGLTEGNAPNDPVKSVCDQVAYFERINRQQQQRLGENRFWIVSYEDFCRRPGDLVQRVAEEILKDPAGIRYPLPTEFHPPQKQRVSAEIAKRIDKQLA